MKRNLFLFVCLFLFLQIHSSPLRLRISNEFIDMFQHLKDDESFDLNLATQAIQFVDGKAKNFSGGKNPYNSYMGDILNEYAKKLFYAKLSTEGPQLQKAYYFFKLAAAYGNPESLYYLSFYSFYNLDGRFLLKNNYEDLPETERHTSIRSYIKNMNTTALVGSAQLSSAQGYNASKYLLGNLYLKGRGIDKNCVSAATYFKELGDKYFTEVRPFELTLLEAQEKRRLDALYFDQDLDGVYQTLKDNPEQQQYLAMSLERGQVPTMFEMAYIYYYGLRSEKRNFEKAFEYFQMAANKGDIRAKAQVGMMLVKGMGVEKDVKKGIGYLEGAAKEGDPIAQTTLGQVYKLGESVSKNETLALEYFKEAAKTNYSDALYSYGMALMSYNPTEVVKAAEFITQAANQGHPLALYHIGLQYIYSDQSGQSCQIGAYLLKTALERGPWSDKLKEGFYAYLKKLYKQAALFYMETALLGSEIGAINAALIIDQYKVFDDYDLDVMRLQDDIFEDPVWLSLNSTYNYKAPTDVHDFLLEDLSEVLEKLQSKEMKIPKLKRLVQPKPNLSKNYRTQLVLKLLRLGAEDQEPLSLLALGDAYQTGKYGEKDYKKAYEQYSTILSSEKPHYSSDILSQTFYNLGYMNHKGLGTEKNLTKAIEYYNISNTLNRGQSHWTSLSKKLAEWESEFIGTDLSNALGDGQEVEWNLVNFVKVSLKHVEQTYAKKMVLLVIMFGVLILILARTRLKNYQKLIVSEESSQKI